MKLATSLLAFALCLAPQARGQMPDFTRLVRD